MRWRLAACAAVFAVIAASCGPDTSSDGSSSGSGSDVLLYIVIFVGLAMAVGGFSYAIANERKRSTPADNDDAGSPPADGIFVNYRRQDQPYLAHTLYERVAEKLGSDRAFIDVDSINPGEDWEQSLDQALKRTHLMIVVIGREWFRSDDADGTSRLSDPGDWVRREIEEAISRKVRLLPVLVDGAELPPAGELPESLNALRRPQFLEIKQSTRTSDINNLLATVERIEEQRGA